MVQLPSIMRVIECRGAGGPDILRLAERPLPQPKENEVLVKVAAAGLNRADLVQRAGHYPPPGDAPADILGMEISGDVVATGAQARRWTIGDKICALISGGGYAEYAAVPEAQALPVPEGMSPVDAAVLPECVITVWANLFEAGGLQPNGLALVHGGSSGIGTFAIQMAKAAGAKIIVTAGSEEKCAACRELGADLAIDYRQEDFVNAIEREIGKHKIDVVLDMVGGDYVARNLSLLAPGGRHVSIAILGGKQAGIDLWQLMRNRLVVTGSTLRHRPAAEKARLVQKTLENAWPWIAGKKVKPLIYNVFNIKEAAAAHKLMESGAHIGKIVLEAAF